MLSSAEHANVIQLDTEVRAKPVPGFSEIFKIGIGPSSSHTVGPMLAAYRFIERMPSVGITRVLATAFGSLAWTGKGHATDTAIVLGLAGSLPSEILPHEISATLDEIGSRKSIKIAGLSVEFDPTRDVVFDKKRRYPRHPNALRFQAFDHHMQIVADEIYYSVGGGVVVRDGDGESELRIGGHIPYLYATAATLLDICDKNSKSIEDVVRANEDAKLPFTLLNDRVDQVIEVMMQCIDRGLDVDGTLPGDLRVARRAKALYQQLSKNPDALLPDYRSMEFVSAFAMAVNEENAAGGRVVTAPTNGAAGVIPAVLRYYRDFCGFSSVAGMRTILLTAAAVGGLIRTNASISGAEVGCQGEVGSASAMAAAGLAAALGGTPRQVENAAEIAMEHHLGMTCDPVGGLVQIPCIERNAFGAVKAVNAAALALRGNGQHRVSLDQVIKTMWETGRDMKSIYKETSRGGLAINVPNC